MMIVSGGQKDGRSALGLVEAVRKTEKRIVQMRTTLK